MSAEISNHAHHGFSETAKPLSLRWNFSWTLLGNGVYAASRLAMLVAIARLGSAEMLGRFALGIAIVSPVFLLTNLQLRIVQATDTLEKHRFVDYMALRGLTVILTLTMVGVSLFFAGCQLETALVILVLAVAKAIESISDVYYGLLQKHERMDRVAMSLILKGIFSLIGLVVGIHVTGTIIGGVAGLALAWAAVLLTYDRYNASWVSSSRPVDAVAPERGPAASELGSRPSPRACVQLAWNVFPLGVAMCLISLNTNIPRYFIEHFWGEAELGIFASMASLILIGGTFVTSLGQSTAPRMAQYYSNGDRRGFTILWARLATINSLIGLAGVLVVSLAGRLLLQLYGPEYAEQAALFPWLMTAAAFAYVASSIGYAATASRRFRWQPLALAASAVVSTISCWLLIPEHGLQGAAWAMIATSLTSIVAYSLLFVIPGGQE